MQVLVQKQPAGNAETAEADSGRHYVCVDLPSNETQGYVHSSFWTLTRQAEDHRAAARSPCGKFK